ncbi:DUF6988 family protein [Arenimonas sp.]|uniref:DUF6988 family protein n=1 Tax=Arenimonas sp. TaxID=1872635 RepID=UPI0039E2474B
MSTFQDLIAQSREFALELERCVALPIHDDSERFRISHVLCSLAFEHGHAARLLAAGGFLPSALAVHRTQFETLLRSMWVLYAANDNHLAKLGADLNEDSEQAARGIPLAMDMMNELAKKAPPNAYKPIDDFKKGGWALLNSYVHAGIHPIKRHREGYPIGLLESVVRNINGLTVVTAMQAAVLAGEIGRQRDVLAIGERYAFCLVKP